MLKGVDCASASSKTSLELEDEVNDVICGRKAGAGLLSRRAIERAASPLAAVPLPFSGQLSHSRAFEVFNFRSIGLLPSKSRFARRNYPHHKHKVQYVSLCDIKAWNSIGSCDESEIDRLGTKGILWGFKEAFKNALPADRSIERQACAAA
jgi:hypothetical protein